MHNHTMFHTTFALVALKEYHGGFVLHLTTDTNFTVRKSMPILILSFKWLCTLFGPSSYFIGFLFKGVQIQTSLSEKSMPILLLSFKWLYTLFGPSPYFIGILFKAVQQILLSSKCTVFVLQWNQSHLCYVKIK